MNCYIARNETNHRGQRLMVGNYGHQVTSQ